MLRDRGRQDAGGARRSAQGGVNDHTAPTDRPTRSPALKSLGAWLPAVKTHFRSSYFRGGTSCPSQATGCRTGWKAERGDQHGCAVLVFSRRHSRQRFFWFVSFFSPRCPGFREHCGFGTTAHLKVFRFLFFLGSAPSVPWP